MPARNGEEVENISLVLNWKKKKKRNGSEVRTYRIAREPREVSALGNNQMLMLDNFCIIWSVDPRVEYILLSSRLKNEAFSIKFASRAPSFWL